MDANKPEAFPVVWSAVGPVKKLGVPPDPLIQSKSSPLFALTHVHIPLSKSQSPEMNSSVDYLKQTKLECRPTSHIVAKRKKWQNDQTNHRYSSPLLAERKAQPCYELNRAGLKIAHQFQSP